MIDGMASSVEVQTDGRIQRSERSREAIVAALLELIGEGVLSPTAQQVAERADVGVRTVFRHFSDMETLFVAMNERLEQMVASYFVAEKQTGPLNDRVDALLTRRVELLERIAPYLRSSALQRARSAFLQAQHDRNVRLFRRDILRWLPELETDDALLSAGLELALSFEAWERLRNEQRLSTRKAAAAVRRLALAILRPLD